jgi:hypothetical protein
MRKTQRQVYIACGFMLRRAGPDARLLTGVSGSGANDLAEREVDLPRCKRKINPKNEMP